MSHLVKNRVNNSTQMKQDIFFCLHIFNLGVFVPVFHFVSNLVDCLHDLELCALLVLCLNVTLVTTWFS